MGDRFSGWLGGCGGDWFSSSTKAGCFEVESEDPSNHILDLSYDLLTVQKKQWMITVGKGLVPKKMILALRVLLQVSSYRPKIPKRYSP